MKRYQSKRVSFCIKDDSKEIMLTLHAEKYVGHHIDDNGKSIDEFDKNQIECSYMESGEGGWGWGCEEYLTTTDLKAMANGIRSVIYHQTDKFVYNCQYDFFCIELQYDYINENYSFSAKILETLFGENYITITKNNLTYTQLEEYIQPFFEWEKQYPIV